MLNKSYHDPKKMDNVQSHSVINVLPQPTLYNQPPKKKKKKKKPG